MLFLISAAQTGIVETIRCKLMTKPRGYGWKISSRDANLEANETNIDGN